MRSRKDNADRRDDDLRDELASHFRMAVDARMARGASREDAEQEARREFGNVTHVEEVTRDTRAGAWLERLTHDIRYGMRSLRRTPAFTIVAILTLALAIGANSAVFTIVNGVLLRPLPFREPNRLFLASYLPRDLPFVAPPGLPDRLYLAYRERVKVFERISAYRRRPFTLSGAGDAAKLTGASVDADFFDVLGIMPALGRGFFRSEEQPGREDVVILSDRLWRSRFAADPAIVGRQVTLDGNAYTVLGVAPSAFTFPASSDMWTPLSVQLGAGNSWLLQVVGRLAPGRSIAQARTELDLVARAMPQDPREHADRDAVVPEIIPLKDTITNKVEKSLYIFTGAVMFVLLIAGANVANLLLIRASTRRHEIAVRVALGASRLRIARQLLTESLLLASAGGLMGVFVGYAGMRALLAMAPAGRIPRLDDIHMDLRVLGLTLAASLGTGIIFGVVPALVGSRREPREALVQGTRTVVGSHGRLRGLLVSVEIALALVLLSGAGLMIKSFVHMRTLDTGYAAARVMTMSVDLPPGKYASAGVVQAFHESLLTALRRIPGVETAGAVSWRPMGGMGITGNFEVDGPTPFPHGYSVDKPTVSAGYFNAMGIRVLRGRDFTPQDRSDAPGVVVISDAVARKIWPGQEAVGKRISMKDKPGPLDWLTVIGVVNDVVQDGDLTRHSTVYLAYLQATSLFFLDHMTFAVRAASDTRRIIPAMRSALRAMDPAVPAQSLQTMDEAMLSTIAEPLFQTRLLTAFSLIALLLAAVGTYGVLAYDVAERSRELGLRMALGATPGNVLRLVLRRTAGLAVIGATGGVLGSLAVTGVLTKSLFEVTPTDPATLIVTVATIVACALLAGYLPARRAMHIDALTALPRS